MWYKHRCFRILEVPEAFFLLCAKKANAKSYLIIFTVLSQYWLNFTTLFILLMLSKLNELRARLLRFLISRCFCVAIVADELWLQDFRPNLVMDKAVRRTTVEQWVIALLRLTSGMAKWFKTSKILHLTALLSESFK